MGKNDIIANWPTDPAKRLRAILDIYPDSPDDRTVLMATFDVDKGREIGLDLGDLRAIAQLIGA